VNLLIFVVDMMSVYCAVGIEFLSIVMELFLIYFRKQHEWVGLCHGEDECLLRGTH
jgi:hypothetical protein